MKKEYWHWRLKIVDQQELALQFVKCFQKAIKKRGIVDILSLVQNVPKYVVWVC
jgi:hypothetical protein